MYPEVGKELKRWAQFIVILLTIPGVIVGIGVIAVLSEMDYTFLGIILAAVIIGVTYFFARLAEILLYAFGELVDRVCSMEEHICTKGGEKPQKRSVTTKKKKELEIDPNGSPIAHRNPDGTWACLYCDHQNAADAKWCSNCGVEANFK